jgi:hypothetical protein
MFDGVVCGGVLEWQLDCLKRRGLLQDVDLASGEVRMHDLYREFAELEVRGKLDKSADLEKRRWGYVDDGDLSELESSPSVGLSHKLIRLLKYHRQSGGNQLAILLKCCSVEAPRNSSLGRGSIELGAPEVLEKLQFTSCWGSG